MPDDNGQLYATVIFKGTYTGTIPSNIDIRFCADTSCATVQQTWITCTGATISGGNWTGCSIQVQNSWSGTTTPLFPQARETNATSVTSSIATNSLAAGSTPTYLGQSNMAHSWTYSAYAQDGVTNSSNCTVASAALVGGGTIGSSVNNGWPISGTNIPGGDTITSPYNSGASTFTITPTCASGTGTGLPLLAQIAASPAANALSVAYINGSIFSADNIVSGTAAWGKPEGVITLENDLGTGINGGVMGSEQAEGGTSISYWCSSAAGPLCTGTGGGYIATQANNKTINLDQDIAFWIQGENDSGSAQADYFQALQNVVAWNQVIRAGSGFLVTPVKSASASIRLAELQCIDTVTFCAYGGGMIDLAFEADAIHLDPLGRVTLSKRQAQAALRWKGISASGYGPQVTSVLWDGNVTVTAVVTQEAGTALTTRGLSSSGGSLSGFRIFGNSIAATISSTAFTQPNQIVFTLSSKPTAPVTFDYQMGAANEATNPVYDNVPPFSDPSGLPLQPTRGAMTATNPPVTGPGRMMLR